MFIPWKFLHMRVPCFGVLTVEPAKYLFYELQRQNKDSLQIALIIITVTAELNTSSYCRPEKRKHYLYVIQLGLACRPLLHWKIFFFSEPFHQHHHHILMKCFLKGQSKQLVTVLYLFN